MAAPYKRPTRTKPVQLNATERHDIISWLSESIDPLWDNQDANYSDHELIKQVNACYDGGYWQFVQDSDR